MKATQYVEIANPVQGYTGQFDSRGDIYGAMTLEASEFVANNMLGWKNMGVTVSVDDSDFISYTGLDAQADRTDPDDTSIEQPMFSRRRFDNA